MFKTGLFSFALCFALFLVVCSCAVISEEAALELKDFKAEPFGNEENSDRSEGENTEKNDESNGARELNDEMQQGIWRIESCFCVVPLDQTLLRVFIIYLSSSLCH